MKIFLMLSFTLALPLIGVAQPLPNSNLQYSVLGKLPSLSHDQVAIGLKQALTNGVQSAIQQLGHEGGFLTNLNVRIPMPTQLQKVETTLRKLKQDKLADEFVVSMNRAAEQAVPEAATVFAEAISKMSIADAQAILTGPPDAATQFFRRTTETNLFTKFLPIVQKTTAAAGVTSSYKSLLQAANGNRFLGGLLGAVTTPQNLDIDNYVANKAMDGLFKEVAEEEKRIRANPVARTTELLQKVFGSVMK